MPEVYLATFTTTAEDIDYKPFLFLYPDLETRQLRLHKSAIQFGIKPQNIFGWNRQKIKKTAFYKENKQILDGRRGAGYWLWKPYIIVEAFKKMKEGDFLFYCDNSMVFIDHFEDLLKVCEQNKGFFFFEHLGHTCAELCKRDAFHFMGLDEEKYHQAPACQSNIVLFQKNTTTQQFIDEWLQYCCDERIMVDEDIFNVKDIQTRRANDVCGKPQLPNFIKHLHDMSVLMLLRVKYDIDMFRIPYQYGNPYKLPHYRKKGEWLPENKYEQPKENSPYNTIFNWEKQGFGAKRPISHYINPLKMYYILKRKFFVKIK